MGIYFFVDTIITKNKQIQNREMSASIFEQNLNKKLFFFLNEMFVKRVNQL